MSSNATETVTEEPRAEEPARLPAPDETIHRMRQAILGGEHWFAALLDAVARWRLPEERIRGRDYVYLVGGEAFDWLLLAERLLDEVPDLVAPKQRDDLLFRGKWPIDMDDQEFAERLGTAKHSAHLNYLYGVLVEEALQLSVEEEIHKENRAHVWGQDRRVDQTMYERVYDRSRDLLLAEFHQEGGVYIDEKVSYADWKAFTYWLFKYRLRRQDKARVASDTRKGLAQLTRMELAVNDRRRSPALDEDDFAARFVS